MTGCSSYLLFLLSLLLITQWTHQASLRSSLRRHPSFIVQTNLTTSEPVLSRRRPLLISDGRRKRWNTEDEIEIPIDDEPTDAIKESEDIYSTMATEKLNITDTQLNAGVKYLSVSETSVEFNQTDVLTTVSMNENTSTESDTGELYSASVNETSIDPSTTDFKQDTAIILLDYTTMSLENTDDNQTLIDTVIQVTSSTYVPTVTDQSLDNTTLFDVTQNDTTFIQEDMNTTAINLDEIENVTMITTDQAMNTSDNTLNETSTITFDDIDTIETKPVCDQSCQCSKKCHYGFDITNDTCQCDPPCQNYQCFGNDTCTVSKNGQPICRPENGTENDRPQLCYQPRDAGHHDESLLYQDRWYYDPEQDQCHLFVYRGLGGNENNFQTLHQCHLECITCAPSPDPGACLGRLPMWYYNHKTQQCAQFDYSGCKGNENKFLRKQDCVDTCVSRILNL